MLQSSTATLSPVCATPFCIKTWCSYLSLIGAPKTFAAAFPARCSLQFARWARLADRILILQMPTGRGW
eukprot:1873602-Lingulodinium_polyedra.AAC.1